MPARRPTSIHAWKSLTNLSDELPLACQAFAGCKPLMAPTNCQLPESKVSEHQALATGTEDRSPHGPKIQNCRTKLISARLRL